MSKIIKTPSNSPIMGRIDTLVNELCPEGVEYVKLGDVCDVLRGARLTKAQISDIESVESPYPVLHGGLSPMGFYKEPNRKAGTTIVVNTGNAGSVYYSENDFWSSDACFSLYPHEGLIDKYLYYYLYGMEYILKGRIRAGAMPTIDSLAVETLQIPLPPLSIQQKIVSVLDSFTTLIDKMKQEVEKRKKQMEYYREKLLAFEDGECEWKTLGEILVIKAGGDVPEGTIKGQSYPTKSCPYPVYSNGKEEQALYGYCPNFRNSNDAITVSARGSIGYHTVRNGGFTPIVRLITMEPKTDDNIFYINYALYLTEILGSQGGIPQLTVPMIKRITIPIPSRERQSSIVSTLDKFESYITKLEKMIVLRQKQYEYYREQLLTFE